MNHDSLSKIDRINLLILVILAAIPRFLLLHVTNFGVEADESIVGLMAKHVGEGRPWPVFYYGQPYMGSFEALLAAGVFKFTGVNGLGLKLVPTAFSLLHVALVYLLALRFTGRFGAFAAAVLTAFGPSGLILWSTKARGGFIELVVIGTVALIIATDLLRTARPSLGRLFFLGAVFGFGWWVNNQMLFYIVTVALVFAGHFPFRSLAAGGGVKNTAGYAAAGLAGFIAGGWPFWYFNLFVEPRFSTVTFLMSQGGEGNFSSHLRGLFSTALPIIFGARRFWSETDLVPLGSWIAAALYLGAYLTVASIWAGGLRRRDAQSGASAAYGILVLFPAVLFLIFAASGFGWLSKEPRYLLPLYSVLFIIVGRTAAALRDSGNSLTAGALVTAVLAINLSSNYLGGVAVPGQPFVAEGQRASADQQPLYDWLAANRYRHMFTNYWIGYRAAFETKEQITFSRYRGPQNLRIPEYEMISEDEREYSPYVLVSREAEIVKRGFAERGLLFRESQVGGYIVLDHVRPEFAPGPEVAASGIKVSASSRPDWAPKILDGDLGSRWGSGSPQRPGMTINLQFPKPVRLSEVELLYGFFKTDAPRDLAVVGVDSKGESCQLFDSAGARLWEDLGYRWPIYFRPAELSELKLVQLGSDPVFDWSLSEMKLYGAAEQESAADGSR